MPLLIHFCHDFAQGTAWTVRATGRHMFIRFKGTPNSNMWSRFLPSEIGGTSTAVSMSAVPEISVSILSPGSFIDAANAGFAPGALDLYGYLKGAFSKGKTGFLGTFTMGCGARLTATGTPRVIETSSTAVNDYRTRLYKECDWIITAERPGKCQFKLAAVGPCCVVLLYSST